MKIIHFKNFSSLQDVKQQYKTLAKANHPDKGGSTAVMQEINNEYDYIIKNKLFEFSTDNEKKFYNEDNELRYKDIINQLLNLSGLNIELCGSWLWISGLTYPVKEQLKKIGCKYASKKTMWYYRPDEEGFKRTKSIDMDEIRMKYGSTLIEGAPSARMLN